MGIFKRIKTIAKADMNGYIDGLENPIAMLNEYSREMEREMTKAQQALASQIFTKNKQAALVLETRGLVEKRTRQAKLAIEQGDESMAKLAVQEKLVAEKQLSVYEQQFELIKGQTALLSEKLNDLQQAYQGLQQKKIILASRANVAQSIKQIQNISSSFQTDNILRGVTRAEDQILLMEAEVQASSGFASPLTKFGSSNVNVEELEREMAKLKSESAPTV
jgi:phage shock protein A